MNVKNSNNFLKIPSVQQLMDHGIQIKIWIKNIPINMKHLTIRSSNLLSLKGLVNVRCREYLDVSGNSVQSYNLIKNLEPLRAYMIIFFRSLLDNKVVNVEPLMGLTYLDWWDLRSNFVQDLEPLILHPNRKCYHLYDQSTPSAQQISDSQQFISRIYLLNLHIQILLLLVQLDQIPSGYRTSLFINVNKYINYHFSLTSSKTTH
ncbi:Leucine-rich_repeat domain superfamily [Hexamita inflata]|uniref:Leucine-rich repeat domain superfamily n=1 Tax=Hexamita inflata TaxID=28002 RepID=A0AA86UAL9_9EUKA|nr:Leucine-rich repeat domain superfamily [Hexamita inflata]CAI9950125.1 Leucine-rich repeat domain superfamily [Hexamita inflata]